MAIVETETEGEIAVIRMHNPPVNALGHALRVALAEALAAANADPGIRAIVLTGTGKFFSAGADISEFKAEMKEPFLPQLIDTLEAGSKPVVAAVNGTALGGGLELALGCHYRVARRDVRQLGLPEIKLGIIPGAGGTQRLPRAIGVEPALQLITSGNFIDAEKAAAAGLIDKLIDTELMPAAIAFAKQQAGKPPRRIGEIKIDKAALPADLFDKARAALGRHPSGPLAPKIAIDAVKAATESDIVQGSARERALFREVAASPYARALQYAFFAERQAANLPGIGANTKLREVETIGVLGAGTMGTGITLAFLNAGFPVTIVETTRDALDKGVARIKDTLSANAKRGRITAAQAADRFAKLTPSLDMVDLGKADLIIEAVFENMALKKEVFGKLDRIAKSGAIIATNTSTLDVDEIAAQTKRPQDVVGLHFFSPANIMRLLEIVRADKTASDVMATAMAIAKRIGKVGVQAGVCDGFVGNRMLAAYGGEVQAMNLEGAMPQEIDGALEGWGMAMGPLAVSDLAGLDVGYRIRKERKLTGEAAQNARIPDKIVEMGRHGQKTGAGYYRYDENRKRLVDPEIEALIRAEAEALQIKQRHIPADEIVERSLLRLANEGAKILEEGIALRASDIDTMYLNGYGFPAWRGGPMWQVDNVIGMKQAAERIKAYEAKYGARWKIAPLIEKLAADGATFANLDTRKN
ncbi:MAG TPA: 3-hydroxyacyl-CoA dehydrogenase NAD-binding domain-containing protein [Hyphomicrobiaceae bacterium]|nr:3-hydroxyacyl-CoA dehydrogenase NAD-binding domain-containing protein [Hyphomicrobiaceae bacterium]